MQSRSIYAICGLFVGAVADIAINLLAAGIQQRAFPQQFNDQGLWGLGGLAVLGLLVSYWLGAQLQLPAAASSSRPALSEKPDIITLTRLRALLSYSKLKGKGIHLSDILLIGSRIDIET